MFEQTIRNNRTFNNKYRKIILKKFLNIAFFLTVLNVITPAQKLVESKKVNIINLKAGHILYADDRVVIAEHDTTIQLPINVDFYIKRKGIFKIDTFYHQIRENAYKRRWTRELHNMIILPDNKKISDTIQTQKSEIPFLPYRNFIIRKIKLKKLNVVGPTIYDTERPTKTWIGNVVNKIHVKTTDRVIFDHLIIKPGDPLDPYSLADNERLLRDLPFIEDARIVIDNVSINGDSVDITVISKDNLSKGFDLTSPDLKRINFDFWDNNILGTGQQIDNLYYRNPGRKPFSGLNGYYQIRNIGGSFINGKFGYNAFGSKGYNIDLSRDFFTQRTKYAGELLYENMNTYTAVTDSLYNGTYKPLKGTLTNIWIGRSFPISKLGLKITNISNFTISAGIFKNYYSVRPLVDTNFRYLYQNKTLYLASFSFSSQGYYRSNLIYNYGRTEDIPFGTLIKITSGFEVNEFYNRLYNAISVAKGDYINNAGYLYSGISFGGFIGNNKFERGILKINTNFFTNLLVVGSYKFRQFIYFNYTKGFKNYKDEYLDLNDLTAIHDHENDSLNSTQKLSLRFESVCFTPYYLIGFRFAFFGFLDFGMIGSTTNIIFNNPLYSGLGFGIRFRNEKFVFKTFQIRFAFYPWLPENAKTDLISITENINFRPANFNNKSPEIITFK